MEPDSEVLLLETFDVISSTTIPGVLHGVTFTLYCLCAWQLYLNLQKPDKRRQATFSLGYILILFLCTTGLLALNARLVQVIYIEHADFPGGAFFFEERPNSATIPYFATLGILELIAEVVTMAIQIRRLWIIWSGTQYAVAVTILPVLLLLSFIALDIPISVVIDFAPPEQFSITHTSAVAMTTASYAIMSAFTILVTGLIATRLLLARRQHVKIMGMSEAASPYLSIVAILVESYLLEAAWSFAAAISYALASPCQVLFLTNDSTIKVIAYFLVIYRVETGQGWTKQTEDKLTSLQWNNGAQTATDEISGIQSQAVPATTT